MAGSFSGTMHSFATFLTGGKSLHPLQRNGDVPDTGMHSIPARGTGVSMSGTHRTVPNSNLSTPPTLNISAGPARDPKFHV